MDLAKLLAIGLLHAPETGETGDGGGSGDDGGGASGGEPSGDGSTDPEPNVVPQDKVDKIVQRRIARERKKYESKLEELGFESFDDVAELKRAQQEAEKKKLEENEQYKELLETTRQEKDEQIQKLQQELEKTRSTHRQTTVQRTLVEAAAEADAVAPSQVAALLSDRVRLDDDGKPFVVGDGGERLTDGQGNEMSVQGYMETFLEENPHFKRAAGGRGAGGRGSESGKKPDSGGFDPKKRRDVKHLQENRAEIIKKMKSGEIQG